MRKLPEKDQWRIAERTPLSSRDTAFYDLVSKGAGLFLLSWIINTATKQHVIAFCLAIDNTSAKYRRLRLTAPT